MNNESFAVMTREQTKQREKVTQPPKKSEEQSVTIPVIARRGSPIPTSSTQKVSPINPVTKLLLLPFSPKVDKPRIPNDDGPSTLGSFDIVDHLKKTK
ncbi:hypothetical protein KI387_032442, partial [Taxus chinensis]